jgi:hypothetical protein
MIVARLRLEIALNKGWLALDDSIEGTRYFINILHEYQF